MKTQFIHHFTIFGVFLFFCSCHSPESGPDGAVWESEKLAGTIAEESVEMALTSSAAKADQAQGGEVATTERKLIKEGSVAFKSDDLPGTRAQVEGLVEKYKGYISKEDNYNHNTQQRQYITVRIPTERFDAFLQALGELAGPFDSKSIQVRDVTEEFIDISSRLETKKALEQRYMALLDQANSVSDILEIERELGTLRSDIESIEGRLRYLKNQIGLSTLRIEFYREMPKNNRFADLFGEGFVNGWHNLVYFLIGMVNVWPFLLLLPLVIWMVSRWAKARRRKKVAKMGQPKSE